MWVRCHPSHPLVAGHSPVKATGARPIAKRHTTSHAALNAASGWRSPSGPRGATSYPEAPRRS
uniref:Uncharacterized protein n=1 Tax=Oryza sativa subsp. japonica TaxID=39947 RepID=Q6ZL76_ORYSJ|nr:hypothetical protein [Oryza sativa Japonica Group]